MLLDEPSLGLSPLLTQEIFEIIVRLNKEQKVTMMLVEQNAKVALGRGRLWLCDGTGAYRDERQRRGSCRLQRHSGILSWRQSG